MTVSDFIALCERFTYKPGWCITARRIPFDDAVEITIAYSAPDADGGPTQKAGIVGRHVIPADLLLTLPVGAVIDLIRYQVLDTETHELNEWLRFDGKRVREPHPEKARAG